VALHCYRYAWAERALECGYPERFAQQNLGHNSKAVHHAHSKNAEVIIPSLEDWETHWKASQQTTPQIVLPAPNPPPQSAPVPASPNPATTPRQAIPTATIELENNETPANLTIMSLRSKGLC
jgi:hypothetical protein